MSYNCDTWKIKKLENLRIPVASLYKHPRKDWHPQKEQQEDGSVRFEIAESVQITGKVDADGILHVVGIRVEGEGSGTAMRWIIEPALAESKGELIASCVWERGDSINQIIVKDGAVNWRDIEI